MTLGVCERDKNHMSICKKCGTLHNLVLKNRETGESIPVDFCNHCIFGYRLITKQVCIEDLPEMLERDILQYQMTKTIKELLVDCDNTQQATDKNSL